MMPTAWGTLGTIEAFWGPLLPLVVGTGLTLRLFGAYCCLLWFLHSVCPKNRFWAVICMGNAAAIPRIRTSACWDHSSACLANARLL
jgi:hypothetical protein